MKRFYTILSGAIVVVFFALTIPSDAYGYIERGESYALPVGCGPRIVAGITSVYAGVDVNSVQSWYCRRTLTDEDNPNGAHCYGEYTLTMDSELWIAKVQADGIGRWRPISVDGDNVTMQRRTPGVDLTPEQMTAHAPFAGTCLIDNDGAVLTWGNVLDFRVARDGEGVTIQTNYAATDTATGIANKSIAGNVIMVLSEEG